MVRVKARPVEPAGLISRVACAAASPSTASISRLPLSAWTVLSASPWKTISGAPLAAAGEFAPRPPVFIAANADTTSCAAPGGTPECTPAAANRSGYSRARIAAIAPPAESPATQTRSASIRSSRHDVARHAGEQRRLALAAALVAGEEPVPALVGVGARRLRRVENVQALLLGQRVHARAGGEVVRVLAAAVQHDHQRQGATVEARRLEQLEAARAGFGGEAAFGEAAGAGAIGFGRRVDHRQVVGFDDGLAGGRHSVDRKPLGVGRDDVDLAHQSVEHVGRIETVQKWALPFVHRQSVCRWTPPPVRAGWPRWLRRDCRGGSVRWRRGSSAGWGSKAVSAAGQAGE